MNTKILEEVFEVIKDRRENPREDSYVSSLMDQGTGRILEKIDEESEELIKAVEVEGEDEIVHESADVLFHIMVLLANEEIEFEQIMEELRGRRKPREGE